MRPARIPCALRTSEAHTHHIPGILCSPLALLSSLSLNLSPKRSKCGLITIVYLTSSSAQSTSLSLFELGFILSFPNPTASPSPGLLVNCVYATGTELWLGMANMRIHRPSTRSVLTVLKDCEPPLTCATARVRPCVGRTEPVDRGIQSICCLKMLDFGTGREMLAEVPVWFVDKSLRRRVPAS